MNTGMDCPKCGTENPDQAAECLRCGVIFSRIRQGPHRPMPSPPRPRPIQFQEIARAPQAVAGRVTPAAWKSLGAGLVMAVILLAIPFLRFILSYLGTLIHELGHTLANWFFGYPALPAFDFLYGGGVTIHFGRSILLTLAICAGLGYLVWFYRKNRLTAGILAGFIVLYGVLVFTSLHQMIITFLGHGTEIVFAGIFLYRALKGSSIRHAVERPLYAAVGFFILFHNVGFAFRLINDKAFRIEYLNGKGGCLRHDFHVIAEDFTGGSIAGTATFFLFFCAAAVAVTWLAFRYEERWKALAVRLLSRES